MTTKIVKPQHSKVTILTFAFHPGTKQETIEKLRRRFEDQEGATIQCLNNGLYVVGPFSTARARKRAKGILREYIQVDRATITLLHNDNSQRVCKQLTLRVAPSENPKG